jgi:formamidopyrimidine-DNA glycosylase
MRGLPEVEVIRRDLEREFVGKKIKSVEATSMRTLRGIRNRKQFAEQLEGRKLKAVERRGTYLVGNLDGTDALVIDLGDRGVLLKSQGSKAKDPDGLQVTIAFSAGGSLRLVDPSGGAQMQVVPLAELADAVPAIGALGMDPLDQPISWQAFGLMLERRDGTLRQVLLDPTFLVGITPVYADEILFEAGLRHDRVANRLTAQEIRRLFRAVVEVLQDAVKHRGVTLDDGFVDLYGNPGEHQAHLQVYGRDGEPCPRCRKPIEKVRAGKGYTYFSPSQV